MHFPSWLTQFSGSTGFLDALHQDCAAMLQHLSYAPDREFKTGFLSCIEKIERIFRTEEQWMEELDFPELKHHREQHAGILGMLFQGQARVMAGDVSSGREIIDKLLPHWLSCHAATMDAALARALQLP